MVQDKHKTPYEVKWHLCLRNTICPEYKTMLLNYYWKNGGYLTFDIQGPQSKTLMVLCEHHQQVRVLTYSGKELGMYLSLLYCDKETMYPYDFGIPLTLPYVPLRGE